MPTVVLIGTLDTKGAEYAWLADRLRARGTGVVLVDAGVMEPLRPSPAPADIPAEEVARAAGADLAELRARGDRGAAMGRMAEGAAAVLRRLHDEGRLDGVLAVGGSSGSAVAGHAMQALPVGVPKLLVSTMGAGDVSPYVGAVDVTMMYSVVDIAGVNRLSERILGNAADAVAGMAHGYAEDRRAAHPAGRPLVAATMFGVTTPAVDTARARLTELGYEVLVFHATGAGGRSMENLAEGGFLAGVLDLTTTELADDLVGGVLSAGPGRATAAGRAGIPQVVSVGALDMVNFGPRETVPETFAGRNLLVHNPSVTLMRTTPAENAELGARLAAKLAAATGPTALYLPLHGVSAIDVEGGPFHDPRADAELFAALHKGLDGTAVEIIEIAVDVNDPLFARAMAERLHAMITDAGGHAAGPDGTTPAEPADPTKTTKEA